MLKVPQNIVDVDEGLKDFLQYSNPRTRLRAVLRFNRSLTKIKPDITQEMRSRVSEVLGNDNFRVFRAFYNYVDGMPYFELDGIRSDTPGQFSWVEAWRLFIEKLKARIDSGDRAIE